MKNDPQLYSQISPRALWLVSIVNGASRHACDPIFQRMGHSQRHRSIRTAVSLNDPVPQGHAVLQHKLLLQSRPQAHIVTSMHMLLQPISGTRPHRPTYLSQAHHSHVKRVFYLCSFIYIEMVLRSTLARAGWLPLSLPSPSAMLPNNVTH